MNGVKSNLYTLHPCIPCRALIFYAKNCITCGLYARQCGKCAYLYVCVCVCVSCSSPVSQYLYVCVCVCVCGQMVGTLTLFTCPTLLNRCRYLVNTGSSNYSPELCVQGLLKVTGLFILLLWQQ